MLKHQAMKTYGEVEVQIREWAEGNPCHSVSGQSPYCLTYFKNYYIE
jgi:hypothetical protein